MARPPRSLRPVGRDEQNETGDTLVEVLVSLLVMSICGLALMLTFTTSITASAEHRNLAALDTVLRSASESALSQIQQQSSALFTSCASASYYNSNLTLSPPTGFSVTITSVQYWTGSSFTAIGAACPSSSLQPQLLTMTALASNGVSDTLSFVVDDPLYALGSTSVGTSNATLLSWSIRPTRRGSDGVGRSLELSLNVTLNTVIEVRA